MINLTELLCGLPPPGGGDHHSEWGCAPKSASQHKPVVVWNITRRCNLRCTHCHSDSTSHRYPGELSLTQSIDVIDDLADYGVPAVLFAGGEPMLHPHFFDLVGHAVARGLRATVSTNGTRMDSRAADWLRDLGVGHVGISLGGIGEHHDRFRGRAGAFQKAAAAFRHCRDAGQKVGLRLTLTRQTIGQLPGILRLIEEEDIPRVCFRHPVCSGRGGDLGLLTASETRAAMRMIGDAVMRWNRTGSSREVLTVDQPADAAFFWLTMRRKNPERADEIWGHLNGNGRTRRRSGLGISNIDSPGDVHPDRFWRAHTLGNVKDRPFSAIWSQAQSGDLFAGLCDRVPRLQGRCADCRFKGFCGGGFRSRAVQKEGNPWAEDPGCYLRSYEIATEEAAA